MLRPLLVLGLAVGLLATGTTSTAEGDPASVLVHLAPGADATALAARAGGAVDTELGDVAVLVVPSSKLATLARDAGVLSVERDGLVRASGASWDGASWDGASWEGAGWDGASWDGASWDGASWESAGWDGTPVPGVVPPWGLLAIGAPDAWRAGAPAHARLVCAVDSGMDASHPALEPNLWTGPSGEHGFNAIDGSFDIWDPAGHGTHLAGIVAASRAQPWPGVSEARVAAAKALAADGTGSTSDVISAIKWCDAQDADIILVALSEDTPTRAFRAAIAAAQRGGALVVAAAGNAGPCERCVNSPADLPGVLAVGAFGPDGSRASFSANGPAVDLLAPGVSIASTAPGGAIRVGSGTSQAAAFVAGAAAYAWSACPDWSADAIARALAPGGRDAPLLDLTNERLSKCLGA